MNILQQCYYPVITAIKNPHQIKTSDILFGIAILAEFRVFEW